MLESCGDYKYSERNIGPYIKSDWYDMIWEERRYKSGIEVCEGSVSCVVCRFVVDTNSRLSPCNTLILIQNLHLYKIMKLKICKKVCQRSAMVAFVATDKGYPGSRPRHLNKQRQSYWTTLWGAKITVTFTVIVRGNPTRTWKCLSKFIFCYWWLV